MLRLRIAIDPCLEARFRPEVHWAWRTLLVAIGAGWCQVSPDSPDCDIAYMTRLDGSPKSRLVIRATPELWKAGPTLALSRVERCGETIDLAYAGLLLPSGDFHVQSGRATCDRDLLFDFFWLVSGQEEPSWSRNRHGHAILDGTPWLTDGGLALAPASAIATHIRRTLDALGHRGWVPRWPAGRLAAAAASHDVDYPEVVRWLEPLRVLKRQGPTGFRAATDVLLGRRTHWCFDAWKRAEQAIGVRSAFYFLARKGSLLQYATGTPDGFYDVRRPRFRAVLQSLASDGWEIGLQASYRAFESLDRFIDEKRKLEEISGGVIRGLRHHYFHLDPCESDDTLLMHERAGFAYDSSLAHDRYVGWRRGLCWPFYPFHRRLRREIGTLQLPLVWMDSQLLAGRRVDRAAVQRRLHDLVNQVARHSGLFLSNVHDYVFDDLLYPGWARAYLDLEETLLSRADFWLATPGAIAEHWMSRHHRIAKESTGLE